MEYRVHRKTGDKISVLGIGTSYISEAPEKEALETLAHAFENGINYADLATAGARTFGYFGKAFASVRSKIRYQVHFGANYETGEYGWITDLETVKRQVDRMLKRQVPDRECFKLGIPCFNAMLVVMVHLGKAGSHLARTWTWCCHHNKVAGSDGIFISPKTFF